MISRALLRVDRAFADPQESLKFDEELLSAGQAVLWFWESTQECVVLGQSGYPERDARLDECRFAGIPVLRRVSGGGAVLLGPGCLNYSLVLPLGHFPECRNVRYSLEWIMGTMRRALGLPGLTCEGLSDLALYGRKVSGNAQRRTHAAVLHHGTLLYNFDPGRAELFLAEPCREPAYRAGRSHRNFLGKLPLSSAGIQRRIVEAWCRHGLPASSEFNQA